MRRTAALAVGVLAALAACRRETPYVTGGPAPAASLVREGARPVDHLSDGELVEGKEKVYALVLPRDLDVQWRFPDRALAKGDVSPDRVANYVRARVREGKISAGASLTVFDGVHTPDEPQRALRIRVEEVHGRCELEVRDVTPPPDQGGSEEERWRRLGLKPNGQPLDPMHVQ